jgi:hypothetical protein
LLNRKIIESELCKKEIKEENNTPTIIEPVVNLYSNPTLENEILKLHSLIAKEKQKGMFGKSAKNEICLLIQEICKSKSDTLDLINSYNNKLNADLIADLVKLSANYTTIKEILKVFITFDIVEATYPHKLTGK